MAMAGLIGKFGHQFKRGISIVQIVVAKFLALNLDRIGDTGAGGIGYIEGRRLVRIFAVTQRLPFLSGESDFIRIIFAQLRRKPRSHRRIVACGMCIGCGGQLFAEGGCGGALMFLQFAQHRIILRAVGNDGDEIVVFGGGADHGRAADIDILDAGFEIGAFGDRFTKWIQIDHHQIDRRNIVFFGRLLMIFQITALQQPAMNFWMQRFHPPIHHFRKAGVIADLDHLDAGLGQFLGRAAGRENFHAITGQLFGEIDETVFIGNGNQRARYFLLVLHFIRAGPSDWRHIGRLRL